MKIIIDTKNNEIKVGSKSFDQLDKVKRNVAESFVRDFLHKNTKLTDYEEDCMWMSYRYCIGRHTIAAHMHAGSIWTNCKNRMSDDRQLFTAFDINREIESALQFMRPYWHFPVTSLNRIYTSAIDIVCQFIEDYNIKSKEDFIKYRDIYIKLYDNERGYTFETVTWDEWLKPQVQQIVKKYYKDDNNVFDITEEKAWKYFETWKNSGVLAQKEMIKDFEKIASDIPNINYYYMDGVEDLFVWNDLVHCFDHEHHHKSILKDGTECEWFWSWVEKTEKHDDGYYYKTFGYQKVRIPLDKWNGISNMYIPDESIQKDIY